MFTLYHTNDFHNKLTEAQAQRLRLCRESVGEHGLLLDAGDAVSSGNITYRPGGEPILTEMSAIGYDAMTVGNREFHFSRTGFQAKVKLARFPVLCANVRGSHVAVPEDAGFIGQDDLPVRPYLVHEAGSWRVVVFGLTVPMITERMLSRKVSAYIFDDPIAAAVRLVPHLREKFQPDVLVALTHIGSKYDRVLAETVAGIDLIVGGHTHTVLEHGERVGDALIVQAGSHGRFFGRVDIERTGDSDAPLRLEARLETL